MALEALKGTNPIHEIASSNEVHPAQVSQRKKALQTNMAAIVERKNAADQGAKDDEKKIERLERKVGQLVIEREWINFYNHERPYQSHAYQRPWAIWSGGCLAAAV